MWESFASMWEKPGVLPHTTHGWLIAVTVVISYYATVKQNERITTYRELSITVRKFVFHSFLLCLCLSLSRLSTTLLIVLLQNSNITACFIFVQL